MKETTGRTVAPVTGSQRSHHSLRHDAAALIALSKTTAKTSQGDVLSDRVSLVGHKDAVIVFNERTALWRTGLEREREEWEDFDIKQLFASTCLAFIYIHPKGGSSPFNSKRYILSYQTQHSQKHIVSDEYFMNDSLTVFIILKKHEPFVPFFIPYLAILSIILRNKSTVEIFPCPIPISSHAKLIRLKLCHILTLSYVLCLFLFTSLSAHSFSMFVFFSLFLHRFIQISIHN